MRIKENFEIVDETWQVKYFTSQAPNLVNFTKMLFSEVFAESLRSSNYSKLTTLQTIFAILSFLNLYPCKILLGMNFVMHKHRIPVVTLTIDGILCTSLLRILQASALEELRNCRCKLALSPTSCTSSIIRHTRSRPMYRVFHLKVEW